MNLRHNPESFFAVAQYDDEFSEFLQSAARDDLRDDSDALAFFSIASDDCGAGE